MRKPFKSLVPETTHIQYVKWCMKQSLLENLLSSTCLLSIVGAHLLVTASPKQDNELVFSRKHIPDKNNICDFRHSLLLNCLTFKIQFQLNLFKNKKVLLCERKRHTARRVAIASPCYSGGGGVPLRKFFFWSEHV